MTLLLQAPTCSLASLAEPSGTGRDRLHISAVEPVIGLGVVRAQVALSHWLVAVVQAPVGQRYTDLQAAFTIEAGWPLPSFPAGYVLLGYLDPRDLVAE